MARFDEAAIRGARHRHPALEPLAHLIAAVGRRFTSARLWAVKVYFRLRFPGVALGKGVRLEPGIHWKLHHDARVAVGAGTIIRGGCVIHADGLLVIGERVEIAKTVTIVALERIEIGDDSLIGGDIRDHDHGHEFIDVRRPYNTQGFPTRPVFIGRNVWLAMGTFVMKGISIGDNCLIGANAVVTKSFPANSLVGGVPARLLRTISADGDDVSHGPVGNDTGGASEPVTGPKALGV